MPKSGPSNRELEIKVAGIGVIAALGGALIGGLFSFVGIMYTERSKREDDRRIERRDAYANYYGDAAGLATQIGLQSDRLIQATSQRPPDKVTLERIRADLDNRRRQIAQDQALVVLVGPKRVYDAGFRLATRIEALKDEVSKDKPTPQEIESAIRSTADALDAFRDQAKSDLGIPLQ